MSGEGVNNPADLTPVQGAIVALDTVVDGIATDVASIVDDLEHVTDIFPSDTNLTCTFASPATADTFGAWAEIVDSAATKLSASFAVCPGHITAIVVESISEDSAIYMFEIAWGAAKTIVTRMRFAGVGKFQAAHMADKIWAPALPVGELIYYRMKTDTAVADTCTLHLRHHCD